MWILGLKGITKCMTGPATDVVITYYNKFFNGQCDNNNSNAIYTILIIYTRWQLENITRHISRVMF